jgi:hypothetical protein
VTFVETITALSDRFLTERSFSLIVEPAIADLAYDEAAGERRRLRQLPLLIAFAGAIWDDAVRDNLWTFAGLVSIASCYYFFFFLLGIAGGPKHVPTDTMATLGIAVVTLSLAPAIVCFWPERSPRSPSSEA